MSDAREAAERAALKQIATLQGGFHDQDRASKFKEAQSIAREALRASCPAAESAGVSEDMVERSARAICREHVEDNIRIDELRGDPRPDEAKIADAVDYSWSFYMNKARAALTAALATDAGKGGRYAQMAARWSDAAEARASEVYEECAKIAEGIKAYDDGLQRSAGCATTGERIAAAIRIRARYTPQPVTAEGEL